MPLARRTVAAAFSRPMMIPNPRDPNAVPRKRPRLEAPEESSCLDLESPFSKMRTVDKEQMMARFNAMLVHTLGDTYSKLKPKAETAMSLIEGIKEFGPDGLGSDMNANLSDMKGMIEHGRDIAVAFESLLAEIYSMGKTINYEKLILAFTRFPALMRLPKGGDESKDNEALERFEAMRTETMKMARAKTGGHA